jgi:hypothetical protein
MNEQSTDTPTGEQRHSFLIRLMAWRCEKCPLCRYARENPDALISRIVRFHGRFCPMWRAHETVYGE